MTIQNFYQYDSLLASGAQPTPEQIGALKTNQFDAVLNISPVSARNALKEEAAMVENYGMDYIHFPVDCSHLRPLHFNVFKGIMTNLEGKKVFVHCGGNIKSSNLIHMYHVLEKGVDESESLNILRRIQNPEGKWFQYFQQMGMQGLGN